MKKRKKRKSCCNENIVFQLPVWCGWYYFNEHVIKQIIASDRMAMGMFNCMRLSVLVKTRMFLAYIFLRWCV